MKLNLLDHRSVGSVAILGVLLSLQGMANPQTGIPPEEEFMPMVLGTFQLKADSSESISIKKSSKDRVRVTMGGSELLLPSRGYVKQMEISPRGDAVMLVFQQLGPPGGAYYVSVITATLGANREMVWNTCMTEKRLEFIEHKLRWVDKLLDVSDFPLVKLEMAYSERPKPPTRVLARTETWNLALDEEVPRQ